MSSRVHRRLNSRRNSRHGVLLLVCLVVLIFFLLTGLTFVLVASQWRQGAESHAAAGRQVQVNWQNDLDTIAMAFVRGDQNPMSPFRFNNLLEDLYGNDSVSGTIASGTTVTKRANGQFLVLEVTPGAGQIFATTHGYYNGQVLSVLTGRAAVESFRIVNYYNNSGVGKFVVAPTDSDSPLDGSAMRILPVAGDVVLINGRPFNGTGLGYDPSTGTVKESFGALKPNLVYSDFSPSPVLGGLDEDYDAPDYNNPWLAIVPPTGTIKPSWYDQALMSYHGGSGREYTFHEGGSMLDNDGDGRLDSYWINPGLPVRRTADGRLFRPLVAMLVVDLDGKVNVNTAGTWYDPVPGAAAADAVNLAGSPDLTALPLPMGSGFGPADINMSYVVGGTRNAEVAVLTERYGSDSEPGVAGEDALSVLLHTSHYGGARAFGPLDIAATGSVALDPYGRPRTISLYRPDGTSELIIADDPYEVGLSAATAGTRDEPFLPEELEALYRDNDADSGSLSRRLVNLVTGAAGTGAGSRVTTESWSLPVPGPDVLSDVLGYRIGASPNSLITGLRSGVFGRYLSFESMAGLRTNVNRPFGNGRTDIGGPSNATDEWQEVPYDSLYGSGLASYLPSATVQSQFPTTIGVDHNNDGVPNDTGTDSTDNVREADELARYHFAKQLYVMLMLLADENAYTKISVNGNAAAPAADKKRMFARRLAQYAINVADFRDPDSVMTPFEYDIDPFNAGGWSVDGNLNTNETTLGTTADRDVVWGCEAPALLLTETVAFHDVRTKDTEDEDPPNGSLTTATTDPDDDYDSVGAPEGSLFVELYCVDNPYKGSPGSDGVWDTTDDWRNRPGDMYWTGEGTINVATTNDKDQPVWRMLISDPHAAADSVSQRLKNKPDTTTLQPESIDALDPTADVGIDRVVWFTDETPISDTDYSTKLTFKRRGTTSVRVRPGEYLVVGPRETTTIGLGVGDVSDPAVPDVPSSQTIALGPAFGLGSPVTGNGGVVVTNTDGQPVEPVTNVLTPAVMVAESGSVGLNISVPEGGYNGAPAATGTFGVPVDVPLDNDPTNNPDAPVLALTGGSLTTLSRENHRTIFLQRLADPSADWDAVTNPYITVDFIPVDITVFNGDAAGTQADGGPPTATSARFNSRQRGKANYNIWPPAIDADNDPESTSKVGTGTSHFPLELRQTLGYLSRLPFSSATPSFDLLPGGFGAPKQPFPWLVWNDRPFYSPYELLQVPASSPQRLAYEAYNGGFRHLLDFFEASAVDHDTPHLYRIFDYLNVPSPFPDAHTILNATQLQGSVATALHPDAVSGVIADTAGFHPPFNVLSKYREPGRINLNTIADPSVLLALLNGRSVPSWGAFVASRRGYGTNLGGLLTTDSSYPSYMCNPFRSAASWRLHPVNQVISNRPRGGIDVTLMRGVFGSAASNQPHIDTSRNSYFAYESLQRLGNLVTTQSNVYAVWMTIGYFEVTPVAVSNANPDGYQLGGELGRDTGEIQRHRAFYLIDRSIPVAFENGQDHNAEKTIRLRRFIE